MRKLASIQVIHELEPIAGADRIELAHVLGWQCVVNKGQFTAPCKAVYFEIDSFLPIEEKFEFLRKSSYKKSDILGEGFRLRTMVFRGQVSQGLLLPISDFPQLSEDIEIGTDVTELLGVRKFEIGERLTDLGTVKGVRPDSIPYTDETRIQAIPEILEEFVGLPYYITTKLDGSSYSIGVDRDGFHVTSHNMEYSDGGFYSYVVKHCYKERLEAYIEQGHSMVLQGELCGPKIQGNHLKLTSPRWFVFTVIKDGYRCGLAEMTQICQRLQIPMVPVEELGEDLTQAYPTVPNLIERAGKESTGADFPKGLIKEGIIIRPQQPVRSQVLNDYLSVKVINNKYLLKQE